MKLEQWIGLLALIVSLYILWQIRQLLLLFFTAVVLAIALNMLVRQLQRWVKQRSWARIRLDKIGQPSNGGYLYVARDLNKRLSNFV